ncbi:hypothetical protein [Methylobacterium dankookense]|uniref:Uncharacterized protein n=1 Tax=Methylobacterium dankookense TaxID=560405 RepID=A0A564G543_9HYPH|nr:hypothetical protein [Methylobacterium dankookense]GJD59269.1 hypothetical protein IFDJLNFL_5197 [Methylobacterium dankookense]VUF15619.1 hypothetical protein MTDSW087_05363 [Methylobacterium dankookense]
MIAKPSPHANLPALVAETPLTPQPPALVLFGRDSSGKPRAAWFEPADAEAATAAAATMPLRVLSLIDEAGRDLARQLARGRILPSGRVHAPFAKHDLYARLIALAGEEAGLRLTADADARPAEAKPSQGAAHAGSAGQPTAPQPGDRTFVGQAKPRDCAEIGLGSLVLAHEGPDDGWWEAEVIGINGRVFSLRWRDYPTEPTILRRAGELALLPPGEA